MSCSNTLSVPSSCSPAAGQLLWLQFYDKQLQHLLDTATPEFLASADTVLVCASEDEAAAMRLLLDRRGLSHIGTRVAAQAPPTKVFTLPQVPMQLRDTTTKIAPHSRHSATFTKSTTSPKARKSQRRRANAGRKATR